MGFNVMDDTSIDFDNRAIKFDPETRILDNPEDELEEIEEIPENDETEGAEEDLELNNGFMDLDNLIDSETEEFPEPIIDRDEMVETSDDQDILGSPHSSFSYDDTLSEQEIDGLSNYNIILEYPQLEFENVELLTFEEELKDWFGYKDLKSLKTIQNTSKTKSIKDIGSITESLKNSMNKKNEPLILKNIIELCYISMGCFDDITDQFHLKDNIFHNISKMVTSNPTVDILIELIVSRSENLTNVKNYEKKINENLLKLWSNQFYYCLTILHIMLLLFNTEECYGLEEKKILKRAIDRHNLLIDLLKSIDRWKWLSIESDNQEPNNIIEGFNSKDMDNETKQILLILTSFKIRNVVIVFNDLLLVQFGNFKHIRSTKDFLKFKWENESKSNEERPESKISSLDYQYYRDELMARYPTFTPPKYEISEIIQMTMNCEINDDTNENCDNNIDKLSDIINTSSLLINQHQHLKNKSSIGFGNDPPDIHIATPMPSPTLTPQHTGNTKNYSKVSEFEHSAGEVKKKLFITQADYPNIYPFENEVPRSIKEATDIFYHHIKDNFNSKQFISTFEDFIKEEHGILESGKENVDNNNNNENSKNYGKNNNKGKPLFIYDENDEKENPMFKEEIESLVKVENFYKESLPYLNSLIYVLLQIVSSNIIPTQQASENGQTRQRTPYTSSFQSEENRPYFSEQLSNFDKQKLEVTRMKETALKSSSTIITLLLRWFKLSHILKFEYLSTILFDQDYIIQMFRYLDSNKIQAQAGKSFDFKDPSTLINNRIVYNDYKSLYYLTDYNFFMKCLKLSNNKDKQEEFKLEKTEQEEFESIFKVNKLVNEANKNPLSFILPFTSQQSIFTVENPNKRCCLIISNLLKTLYHIISHYKIQRIYKLMDVRPTEILRFYLTLYNTNLYKPILKIIKLVSPFNGKKWRSNNMDMISFVYLFYKVGLKDQWLNNFFNGGIEERVFKSFENEFSLRCLLKFYNFKKINKKIELNEFNKEFFR